MSKPGKSLKGLCKKLGIRLTVKRGQKRVYKSVKVLKRQCDNKKKKKKVKRKRRFGGSYVIQENGVPVVIHRLERDPGQKLLLAINIMLGLLFIGAITKSMYRNWYRKYVKKEKKKKRGRKFGTTTKWIAPGEDPYKIHNLRTDGRRVLTPGIGTKLYVIYKGKADVFTNNRIGPEQAKFGGLVRRFITDGHWISVDLEITEAPSHPQLLGETLRFINQRDILSVFPKTKEEDMRFFNEIWNEMVEKSSSTGSGSDDMVNYARSFLHPLPLNYEDYFYAYDGGYFGKRKRKRKKK